MKSWVKKILKAILVIFVLLLLSLLCLPYFYKNNIAEYIKNESSNYIDADLVFDGIDVFALKSFPKLTVELDALKLIGKNKFKGVELINVQQVAVEVDLLDILIHNKYQLNKLNVNRPIVNLITLEDGSVNYDIYITDDENQSSNTVAESSPFEFKINTYSIENANLNYVDKSYSIQLIMDSLNHYGSFVLNGDSYEFKTNTSAADLNFSYDEIKYFNKTKLDLKFNGVIEFIGDDLVLEIIENQIKLNRFNFGIEGSFKMLADDYDMDFNLITPSQSFKNFYSIIPGAYRKDFDQIEAKGNFGFDGHLKGMYNDEIFPSFQFNLNTSDAFVQYPGYDHAIENVNLLLKTSYPGGSNFDLLDINLEQLNLSFLNSTLAMSLRARDLESDPKIKTNLNAELKFDDIKKVMPIDSSEISGMLNANLKVDGKYSSIEKEEYDQFNASGLFELSQFHFASKDFDQTISISGLMFDVKPNILELTKMNAQFGESDFSLKGTLENYWPYILRNQNLDGSFILNSNQINLDELMGNYDTTSMYASVDSLSVDSLSNQNDLSVFSVPENIHFFFNSNVSKLIYDSLPINNFNGTIVANHGKVHFNNFAMNIFNGGVNMDATYYSTATKRAKFLTNMDIKNISFDDAYTYFNTIKKYTPIVNYFEGNFSTLLEADLVLNEHYYPVYSDISSSGKLTSDEVEILANPIFDQLKSYAADLFKENKKVENLNLSYEFKDGKFILDSTALKLNNYDLTINGYTSLDQKVNYNIISEIPVSLLNNSNKTINTLLSKTKGVTSISDHVPLVINISGDIKSPVISTSLNELNKQVSENVKDKIEDQITDVKDNAIQLAEQKAAEIIRIAKENAQKLRDEANEKANKIELEARKNREIADKKTKEAVDKFKKEGYKAAEKVIEEAKTPVAKIAAKKVADKMKKETDEKAKALENKLNKTSENAEKSAFKQAEKIRVEADEKAKKMEQDADKKAKEIIDSTKK